ncbi:hypothetical protein L0156_16160 [bacterium]|nr:hypothetical protein [bacterium]
MANDALEDSPPLLEVILQLQFDPNEAAQDRLAFGDQTMHPSESIVIRSDRLELHNSQKISFGRLREHWSTLLPMILNTAGITKLTGVSLSYSNEIPLQDLRNFQNYLNISFQMPASLKDRIEFFRTEFTYRYEFGEIRVWLQPDWDDQIDGYCIQLNMESRNPGPVNVSDLIFILDEMHSGLKDVFRQILSEDYIRCLPQ